MGSKALYRKYRSKTLDEVVGQQHITDTLKNALSKGAISHAYLFTGPRGVGKTSIARILAHEINQLPYDKESTHLDIIEIDAASNRRIDEIRELRDKVHIAPTSAKYKVYIIDEVHMLTREAFNALLKTLEEPPDHAVFILATTESHKVPDTITSRTQKFTFKPISADDVANHLLSIAKKENINISENALRAIAAHGYGSFRDSISMLDQLSGLGKDTFNTDDVSFLLGLPNEESVENILASVGRNDTKQLFAALYTLREQGIDINQAARSLSTLIRNRLIDGSLPFDHTVAIKLLKDLLPLTNGPADFVAFELCLLDAMDLDKKPPSTQTDTIAVSTPDAAPIKDPDPARVPKARPEQHEQPNEKVTKKDQSTENSKTQQPNELQQFSPEKWKQLLEDMKGNHNTLYGILRMAEASQKDQKITLVFKFGFHKKRIESTQNNQTLREYISKHFGAYDFISSVNNKTEIISTETSIHKKTIEEKDTSGDIASVSNIFGGAELLE